MNKTDKITSATEVKRSKAGDKIKCTTCIHKFECLAKHYIPDNYGQNCKEYAQVE